jgi:hypothetical protein
MSTTDSANVVELRRKRNALHQIQFDLWKQHPAADLQSTWGKCCRKDCVLDARGSGVCSDCLESDLAKLVGEEMAASYHMKIVELRQMEQAMVRRLEVAL